MRRRFRGDLRERQAQHRLTYLHVVHLGTRSAHIFARPMSAQSQAGVPCSLQGDRSEGPISRSIGSRSLRRRPDGLRKHPRNRRPAASSSAPIASYPESDGANYCRLRTPAVCSHVGGAPPDAGGARHSSRASLEIRCKSVAMDRGNNLLLAKAVWGSMGGVGRARMADKQRVCVFVGDRWWRLLSAFA